MARELGADTRHEAERWHPVRSLRCGYLDGHETKEDDKSAALAREGYGLTQAPRFRFEQGLASGALVEVYPKHPSTPISVLYPSQRHVLRRLRVFIDWFIEVFGERSG